MPSTPQAKAFQILVGRRIRRLRELAGFTQEHFAETADLDRSYYGGLERGEENLSLTTLLKIANKLVVNARQLLPTDRELEQLVKSKKAGPKK
jgi:transcriptional regulator with XRE-family HTH domain